MSITPRALKEMAAKMAEGPLRTAKTIPLADALFDAAERIDHLNAEIARLREALKDARNNGLIYWEPRTERGHVSKAQMLSRIDAALAEQGEKP